MTEPSEAAKKAARDEAKGLIKEAIAEFQTEETARRTAKAAEDAKTNPPKSKGFFESLTELFGG